MTKTIPFNRASKVGRELGYIGEAIASGHLAGDGPFTNRCTAILEAILGAPKVLLTTSCTHALEMTALLLDLKAGDEVIVPSFTFVSTPNAYVLRGARPVFCDIRHDTLNMDERLLEGLVTSKTRAVVPVHYAGVACAMDEIMDIAGRHGLAVVEDNAHGLFGKYRGKPLGTFGGMATQSFHETKNVFCGEGGALVINDPSFMERAEIIREKGTNRARFFRGQIDKYTWLDVGSSYLPSEILAAFLLAQLEEREAIQAQRQRIWKLYHERLSPWIGEHGVSLPTIPPGCDHPFHLYYLILPSLQKRQALIAHLKKDGISAVFHYLPLHLSDMGKSFGGRAGDCPVTEDLSDRLLRLPMFYDLAETDVEYIVNSIRVFFA